jgi:predicted DNA binding CopG/RHH family protein
MAKYDPKHIDPEERALLKDIKRMDARTLKLPTKALQDRVRKAARAYVLKESKMNIRIATTELAQIKQRAEREGLKYQSLVKSVLHKYVTGQLVERDKRIV